MRRYPQTFPIYCNGKFLYSAVSCPCDCSKRRTLYSRIGRFNRTPSRLLWESSPHVIEVVDSRYQFLDVSRQHRRSIGDTFAARLMQHVVLPYLLKRDYVNTAYLAGITFIFHTCLANYVDCHRRARQTTCAISSTAHNALCVGFVRDRSDHLRNFYYVCACVFLAVVIKHDIFHVPAFISLSVLHAYDERWLNKNASSYIAQYPIPRTVQSALHFTSVTDLFTQTPSRLLWEATISARRLHVHISNIVCSQVLIYTAH